MNGGYVMNLQNFSVNDGEGIRTNIFMAGCPLCCTWCANPEGQTLDNKMTSYMTAEEVIRHVKKQMIFYQHSGGGVTFSGGEATVQEEFLRTLTSQFYDMGISLALETCGYFSFSRVEDILKKMDLIFLDLKHMDAKIHKRFTGVSNEIILENAVLLGRLGVQMVIRIPVIHGVNATDENMIETFKFIKESIPCAKLEILPYHTLGESKYKRLGMELPPKEFGTPAQEEMDRWIEMAEDMGIAYISYK